MPPPRRQILRAERDESYTPSQPPDRRCVVCAASVVAPCPYVNLLKPSAQDYFILKPTHSGFYGTLLERLLEECRSKR
jgi:hypothetical protein